MTRKIDAVSVYEVFLCMFVILIHTLSEGVTYYAAGSAVSALFLGTSTFVSFAVPAFVFTSGMKLCMKFREVRLDYPVFMLGRIRKIYLPYLFWTVIYYIYFVYRGFYPLGADVLLKFCANGRISAQFYFIIVIMQFYLLMPLWLMLCRKCRVWILLAAALLLTILSRILLQSVSFGDRMFTSYAVFWLIGCISGMAGEDKLRGGLKKHRVLVYSGWIFIAAVHIILRILHYWSETNLQYPPIVTILFSISAMLGFYLLISDVTERMSNAVKRGFARVASASYYIFLVHILLIVIADYAMYHFGVASYAKRFILRCAMVYPASIFPCVAYSSVKAYFKRKKIFVDK